MTAPGNLQKEKLVKAQPLTEEVVLPRILDYFLSEIRGEKITKTATVVTDMMALR